MNKTIIAVSIAALVLAGGYFFLRGAYQSTPPQPSTPESATREPSEPSAGQTPIAGEKVVTYTDAGYSPATLRVARGETVTFKNQSSRSMWTASAVHPTHRVYPTTGGCLGSTFDACKGVQPGDSWSFTFDIAGTWNYHNHVHPDATGTISVE